MHAVAPYHPVPNPISPWWWVGGAVLAGGVAAGVVWIARREKAAPEPEGVPEGAGEPTPPVPPTPVPIPIGGFQAPVRPPTCAPHEDVVIIYRDGQRRVECRTKDVPATTLPPPTPTPTPPSPPQGKPTGATPPPPPSAPKPIFVPAPSGSTGPGGYGWWVEDDYARFDPDGNEHVWWIALYRYPKGIGPDILGYDYRYRIYSPTGSIGDGTSPQKRFESRGAAREAAIARIDELFHLAYP